MRRWHATGPWPRACSPRSYNAQMATTGLMLARWRGDLGAVLETIRSLDAALAAQRPHERALGDDLRAVALENVGIAELWSSRLDDARRDLEEALALVRRTGRPWLEISCLGHLGIAGPLTGLSFSAGMELSEEAVRIAEAHGWQDQPILASALAAGATALLWLGRFDEGERWLERARRTLRPDGEPSAEPMVHYARGLLLLAQRRFEGALAAFRAAERMQALLTDKHPFAVPTRARRLQTLARTGHVSAARAALADISAKERETAAMRMSAAVIDLAEGEAEQAVDVLAPVIERSAPTIHPSSVAAEAQVLDAEAREQLGDRRAAEASLERALELTEPEGIVLPFILAPVQDLLDRLPRHRTAHATLLQTILGVLAGSSRRPCGEPAPLLEELSKAELRIVRYLPSNLTAPEIAAELCVSANTVRTIFVTSTPSSTPTTATRRSPAPDSWGCSHLPAGLTDPTSTAAGPARCSSRIMSGSRLAAALRFDARPNRPRTNRRDAETSANGDLRLLRPDVDSPSVPAHRVEGCPHENPNRARPARTRVPLSGVCQSPWMAENRRGKTPSRAIESVSRDAGRSVVWASATVEVSTAKIIR